MVADGRGWGDWWPQLLQSGIQPWRRKHTTFDAACRKAAVLSTVIGTPMVVDRRGGDLTWCSPVVGSIHACNRQDLLSQTALAVPTQVVPSGGDKIPCHEDEDRSSKWRTEEPLRWRGGSLPSRR